MPAQLAGLGAAALLPLGAVAALGSCSQDAAGEWTAAMCTNGRDDDGDRLFDCGDPDCWVFCPPQKLGAHEPDPMLPEAHAPDAEVPAMVRDSGRPMTMPTDDAGEPGHPDDPDDAGTSPACETCPAGEACIDGICQRAPLSDDYEISARSAVVPLSTPADQCFDYTNATCTQRTLLFCECVRPDPYVVVLLDDKVLEGATTPERLGTASPVWTDAPSVTVRLTETSKLTFVVYDWDGIGTDTEIFRCSPDLSPLTSDSDVLSCSPDASMTVAPPRGANFSVAVSVEKVEKLD